MNDLLNDAKQVILKRGEGYLPLQYEWYSEVYVR